MKKIDEKFVICMNNRDYPSSLELHKVYRVLTDIEANINGDIRVIDESGEDYLYPADYFVSVNLPIEVKESLLALALS